MEIEWKPIEPRYSIPYVKIYNSQLSFNASVCSFIDNIYDYKYAIVSAGIENGGVTKLAVKFVKEYEPNVLNVRRKKRSNGIFINSQSLVEYITRTVLGENLNIYPKYLVIKLDSHTIAIDFSKQLI